VQDILSQLGEADDPDDYDWYPENMKSQPIHLDPDHPEQYEFPPEIDAKERAGAVDDGDDDGSDADEWVDELGLGEGIDEAELEELIKEAELFEATNLSGARSTRNKKKAKDTKPTTALQKVKSARFVLIASVIYICSASHYLPKDLLLSSTTLKIPQTCKRRIWSRNQHTKAPKAPGY
jgi:hypothetical protein